MTDTGSSRSDRVGIDETVVHIYKALTEDQSIEQAPFRTMKDIFMLAVCLGYQKGVRRDAPSGAKTTIRKEVFSERDFILLKAIAIATTGDVEVLQQQSNILTIAEEYAQVGIHDVNAYLLDQSGRPLWNLVELVNL
jgi:dnd system-associated protein 4